MHASSRRLRTSQLAMVESREPDDRMEPFHDTHDTRLVWPHSSRTCLRLVPYGKGSRMTSQSSLTGKVYRYVEG